MLSVYFRTNQLLIILQVRPGSLAEVKEFVLPHHNPHSPAPLSPTNPPQYCSHSRIPHPPKRRHYTRNHKLGRHRAPEAHHQASGSLPRRTPLRPALRCQQRRAGPGAQDSQSRPANDQVREREARGWKAGYAGEDRGVDSVVGQGAQVVGRWGRRRAWECLQRYCKTGCILCALLAKGIQFINSAFT